MGIIKKALCRKMTVKQETHCYCKTHGTAEVEEPKRELLLNPPELDILNGENEQLLTEILVRLPGKCIGRYKAVCKRWCRLISSTYFITQSINCRQLSNSFTLVFGFHFPFSRLPRTVYPFQAISTHPTLLESFKNLHVELGNLNGNRITQGNIFLEASCDDLLLCSDSGGFYYVINLLTRQSIVLPTPYQDGYAIAGILGYIDRDGCYKFKVIRLPNMVDRHLTPPGLSIQVFCSELRQWSRFSVDWDFPLPYLTAYSDIVAHRGRLHWVSGNSLFSLDVFNVDPLMRLSHSISLPDGLGYPTHLLLGACQGQLRVASFDSVEEIRIIEKMTLNVWELEDCQKGVWILAHRVLLGSTPVWRDLGYFRPKAFHPYHKDLIFLCVKEYVVLFNMRTGAYERYCILRDEHCAKALSIKSVCLLLHPLLPTTPNSNSS